MVAIVTRKRADVLMVEQGLEQSRERARALIMEGCVYLGGQKVEKPGQELPEDAKLELRGKTLPYVSRGGLKLEKAMRVFDITLEEKTCMDIGASTGGFTDCMLQNGAARVYSIDVGYGQLAWKLRQDPRVICLERTNVRYLTKEQVPQPVDFASVDVSFISLTLVLPVAREFLAPGGRVVCLIKPQFEAGRGRVGKKGVVREPSIHREVIEKIAGFAAQNGFFVLGLDYSPVKGPEGNIEYLLYLQKIDAAWETGTACPEQPDIARTVELSHSELGGE